MRLGHSDFRRLNDAIAAMYRRAFTVGPAAAITETLVSSLGESMPSPVACAGARWWRFMRRSRSLPPCDLAGNALLLSDFISRKDWSETDLYQAGWGALAYEDDLGINLCLTNGNLMSVSLMRESRTFREEDREILSLLSPHMQTLFSPPTPVLPPSEVSA